jgi:CheY-like chemotaxis protein
MSATILVIDDDPSIVHLLKESLQGEGYRVLEGYDGKMAMELATTSHPQLIIMDLNMPGVDGMKALEILRQNPATARIPVVFLTGESSGHLPAGLSALPLVSHLTKPIELDRLNSVVQKVLLTPGSRPQS